MQFSMETTPPRPRIARAMKRARSGTVLLEPTAPNTSYFVLFLLLAACRSNAFCTSSKLIKFYSKYASQLPSSRLFLSQGMRSKLVDFDDEDEDDDSTGKRFGYAAEDDLQRKIDKQQEQINLLLSLVQQQQMDPPSSRPKSPASVAATFSTTPVPKQASVATAMVNPLKAMLFIDGTWLYYSIHERESSVCPITQRYGRGWQRRYYFDWSALPRVICAALQHQDPGWAVQSRPVEIVRATVFTSYKADTSPNSYRFLMYQDMSNANYDVHMMETVGRNEKCVDINIAVEMLHYATVPNAYDVALLLTGDKDFIPAMIRTRQKGRRVGLVSMRRGCNRALYETPTDGNHHKDHKHQNIRDYDVVWIDDHLEELIQPKRETAAAAAEDATPGDLTSFTFTKVVTDFISQSGLSRVNSRDIGRYLKLMTIGEQSMLDELKVAFGGLHQFFLSTDCFFVEAKSDYERHLAGQDDRSYWVGLTSDADMTLMEAAKTAKLSSVEKGFFDSYTLEPLEDKDFAYFKSRQLSGLIEASRDAPLYVDSIPHILPTNVSFDDDESDKLDLPEYLTRDYSQFKVPKLKDYCLQFGLKVTGTKADLLDRIQTHVDREKEELHQQHDERQRSRLRQSGDVPPQMVDSEQAEYFNRDYSQLTLAKLKEFCREKDLKVSGTKADLLERIQALLEDQKNKFQKEKLEKLKLEREPQHASSSILGNDVLGYLESLVVEFAKASGGQANSRDLGRYLAANKASPARLSLAVNAGQQQVSALQELKECHGSIIGFVHDRPLLFERRDISTSEFEDPNDPMNKFCFYVALTQSPLSPPKQKSLEDTQDQFGRETKDVGYLEELIAGYVKTQEGRANSRDLGKYLALHKASPERLSLPVNSGQRISALQELKEKYGTIFGFLNAHADLFERREIDPCDFPNGNDPHNKYTFYVALKDSSPSLVQHGSKQARQEVS